MRMAAPEEKDVVAMEQDLRFDVVVIGAGSVGLSVAYYLARVHGFGRIAIVDALNPMSLTSAQSGENYRNWWPDPMMVAFTNHSIDLLEEIARATGDRIQMIWIAP